MVTPSWIRIFLDVPAPSWDAALAFWPAASGCSSVEILGETGQFARLVPAHGDSWVEIQRIDDARPRVHLDLDSTDRPAAVRRSLDLGAQPAWTRRGEVAVMRSPGGLLYCHTVDLPTEGMVRDGLDIVLDQVSIDIPEALWEAEVAFWQQLTGRSLERGRRPEFAFLGDPDPAGAVRILLQRVGSGDTVTAHPDFAVADRPAQTVRHESLGAVVEQVFERWTVLVAPDGRRYCLTDRDPATGRLAF
ncbi:VOC family protein [Branchiibius sp. NY16-3462-2]|uniref:VOC family protein n=1 Tax=Branchiibius sp. NY16-3462-2 TaxID=1807500 RepID=UPI0025C59143|nr:VOC family protein [Branchiibius sp. NY16-3462-2]